MPDLAALLTGQVLGVFAVFARLGAVLMFIPAFGEQLIPARHRLAFAVVLSIALYPALPVGPLALDQPLELARIFAVEISLGLWIGLMGRILLNALQFAGFQAGYVSGLANAFAPNTGAFEGATLMGTALMLAGVALIFATDMHHLILRAIVMSYSVFPAGVWMPGDLASQAVRTVAQSFYIGVMLTAPFYVLGLTLNAGLGLANRMMPQLPVFFVAAPVLIAAGIFVLMVTAPSLLSTFTARFADWLRDGFVF